MTVSLVAAALFGEVVLRAAHREFGFKNFHGEHRNFLKSAYPAGYSAQLGWVPQAGWSGENVWGTTVTILDGEVRSNGPAGLAHGERPLLTVGDSFTFGDQVSDHETWPAALERRLQSPVINGGVFGYGVDQIYLRADELCERYRPHVLIFSFFPDDVSRCEFSTRYGLSKPFYSPVDGGRSIVLDNVPVPQPTHATTAGRVREVLGYSLLAHVVMMRVAPDFWLRGNRWEMTRVHSNGIAVACRLLSFLPQLKDKHAIDQVVVLVQYAARTPSQDYLIVDNVLKCVDRSQVTVLDLREALEAARTRGDLKALFDSHMTAAGNEFVARELESVLR